MALNRVLDSGRGWEPCRDCGLPCIISESWSVYGGTISYGCAACLVKQRNALELAAKEARDVLALCTTRRFDAPEDFEVGRLGARIGCGALISAASKEWSRMFDGMPQQGTQHTGGPCEATVKRTLAQLDDALRLTPSATPFTRPDPGGASKEKP